MIAAGDDEFARDLEGAIGTTGKICARRMG
jgi:hypothetical protein